MFHLIAKSIDSNIRELEGALTRVLAYARLVQEPVTVDLCKAALREVLNSTPGKPRMITCDYVMQVVAEYYNLTPAHLTSKSRRREMVVPRQIAIYLTRELTNMSLPQIGTSFGNRDHTTIIQSIDVVTKEMQNTSSETYKHVADLKAMITDAK